MSSPKFSVIIPAFKYGDFVGQAVQSVLDQTYPNLEVIVVDDASPDHTAEVIAQFDDPRVKYLVHEVNRGLPATRNTGIRAASGEIIALLDADDYYHKEKLAAHLSYLEKNPEIGVSYNPRYELNHSAATIRELYRPPLRLNLAQNVMDFQFAPSDMVIRREWIDRVGMFDEALVNGAEDMDFPCRMALAGCAFGSVDVVLNFRRYHKKRVHKNLKKRKIEYDMVLNRIFDDPRCPDDVRAMRGAVIADHNLYLIFLTFAQGDTEFGQELLREAVQLKPSILEGSPTYLIDYLLTCSINHGEPDHGSLLKGILEQLPPELKHLSGQYDWAVRQGYLLKGIRAVTWQSTADGAEDLEKARKLQAQLDEPVLNRLAGQLWDIENVIGKDVSRAAMERLFPVLERFEQKSSLRALQGRLFVNQAFKDYREKEFSEVPERVLRAVSNDPRLIWNKGVLSIFFRSVLSGKFLFHSR